MNDNLNYNTFNIYNKFFDKLNEDFWGNYKRKCLEILSDTDLKEGFAYDFGCGTGLGLEFIRELGYKEIRGIDFSVDMIEIAKSKYYNIDFIIGDMLSVSGWEPGALAVCNFDTINYLIGDNDWKNLFSIVTNSLKKDGIFLFDILTENDHKNNWPNSIKVTEEDNYTLITHGEYKNEIAYMYYIWFIKDDHNVYKKHIEVYKQKSYSKEQIRKWLNDNNLKIVKVIDVDSGSKPSDKSIRLLYNCIKV